jgi:polar amino acid transport system substrate-binding protein
MRRVALILGVLAAIAGAGSATGAVPAPPTLAPGVLSVSLAMPSAGFQVGSARGPEVVFARGFEVDLANALAGRMGLRAVFTQESIFTNLLAAGPKTWDVALAQVTITAARKQTVDFSLPYLSTDQGVLLRPGLTPAPANLATLRRLRLCVEKGTTGAAIVASRVKPAAAARRYPDTTSLWQEVENGSCDAVVYDAPTLAVLRGNAPLRFGALAGVIRTNEKYGIVLADASPLTPAVNTALTSLIRDGSVDALSRKWLSVDVSGLRVLG